MKTKRLGKLISCLAVILAVTVFSVTDVLAWNWGVHAYIDDHLGKRGPLRNMNEMYGSTAPDLFNYTFNPQLYAMTHNDFMKVWNATRFPLDKASAFGFVSHNDVWGADSTAHHACRTCADKSEGYVIEKATLMISEGLPPQLDLLYQDKPEVVLEIYHNFVEAGVDILMNRLDPDIGKKLTSAAVLRSPTFPLLLVKAYTEDVATYLGISHAEAAKFITAQEAEFRKSMVLYGYALMQDDATAVLLLSEQLADVAEAFLGAYGYSLVDLGITKDDAIALSQQGILAAISLCEDDYEAEINKTIQFVGKELKANGISY